MKSYLKATMYGVALAVIWWGIARDRNLVIAIVLSVPVLMGTPQGLSDRDRITGAVLVSLMWAVATLYGDRRG